jgi:hypothetical protein
MLRDREPHGSTRRSFRVPPAALPALVAIASRDRDPRPVAYRSLVGGGPAALAAFGRRCGGVRLDGFEHQVKSEVIGWEREQAALTAIANTCRGATVDEEVFNMSTRKFRKKLGVTAQREIELAVRERLEGGDLQGDETLDATATVTVAGLSRDVVVTGQISLA